MKWPEALKKAIFLKRYKRFLVDCQIDDEVITVHCANSGRMTGCMSLNADCLLSTSANINRKYPNTLELIKMEKSWVCVNTQRANQVAIEYLEKQEILELQNYTNVRAEVVYPNSTSRVDVELIDESGNRCFVEVKSCTLVENGVAMFPDAPTVRGQKHLDELMHLVKIGIKPVILFLVMRNDATSFQPAKHIDPVFSQKLEAAKNAGVEVLVYHVETSPEGLILANKILY